MLFKKEPLRHDANGGLHFVIGDARSRTNQLEKMFDKIIDYKLADNDKIVVMGNFISFNDNVRDTLVMLGLYKDEFAGKLTMLRGKNENDFIRSRKHFLQSPQGHSIIKEYRTKTVILGKHSLDYAQFTSDRRWVQENTKQILDTDKFFMCASGINPSLSIEDQNVQATMYMQFKESSHITKTIVHGSQPVKKVDIKPKSLNLSTEDYLSCAVLDTRSGVVKDILTT